MAKDPIKVAASLTPGAKHQVPPGTVISIHGPGGQGLTQFQVDPGAAKGAQVTVQGPSGKNYNFEVGDPPPGAPSGGGSGGLFGIPLLYWLIGAGGVGAVIYLRRRQKKGA